MGKLLFRLIVGSLVACAFPVQADVEQPATILDFLQCSSISEGGEDATSLFGPTPYLQVGDTPADFFDDECPDTPHFEDFEDAALDPFLAIDNGSVLAPGSLTDSVDGDDGAIDGLGDEGHSWFSGDEAASVTVTFASPVTAAGLVFTDGDFATTQVKFEAFDASGVLIGTIDAGDLTDQSYYGTTDEDRFLGITSPGGIGSIRVSIDAGTGIEIDHIQWQTCPTDGGEQGFDDNDDDYDVLLALLAELGLDAALDDPAAGLTLFAPTDGGFKNFAQDIGFTGGTEEAALSFIVQFVRGITSTPRRALDALVRYHEVDNEIDADIFLTLSENELPLETLLTGSTILPNFDTINDVATNLTDPQLINPGNVETGNGFVHTIDRLLVPAIIPLPSEE